MVNGWLVEITFIYHVHVRVRRGAHVSDMAAQNLKSSFETKSEVETKKFLLNC